MGARKILADPSPFTGPAPRGRSEFRVHAGSNLPSRFPFGVPRSRGSDSSEPLGGIVKAEGLGDGRTHSKSAIAKLRGLRLTMPPTQAGDLALARDPETRNCALKTAGSAGRLVVPTQVVGRYAARAIMLKLVNDREIYEQVICEAIPKAKRLLWLATADLKDLHVHKQGKMVPFLEVLSDLARRNVEIRLLHAKEPGPAFRRDFDRYRNLAKGLERMLCPRVHLKCVVVDGGFAYLGSANLTGAGVGAKSTRRRNFEAGIVTTEPALIGQIMEQFDGIWRGSHCSACDRKEFCDEHTDILPAGRGRPH